MRVLGIMFYTAILVLIGLAMISFVFVFSFARFQPQCIQYVNDILVYLQHSFHSRAVMALSGFLLILISYSFAQLILGKFQREKTIAFKTASGEVTVALSAVEDLVRKIAVILPEVKELRPDVKAGKKGITVDLRVVLRSEANIPELTVRLQDIARSRIQEVLGVEEQIIIKIHVIKIISDEKERRRREAEKEEQPRVPFSGYGRI